MAQELVHRLEVADRLLLSLLGESLLVLLLQRDGFCSMLHEALGGFFKKDSKGFAGAVQFSTDRVG